MNIKSLRRRFRRRLRRRKRQGNLWQRTHRRGHAKAAHRDARAVRYLRHLIAKARAKLLRQPTVMYDSTVVDWIPNDAKAVAGYINGLYANIPEMRAAFPHAKVVTIAVFASADADCLDMEPGDAGIQDFPAWCQRQHARGVERPIAYVAASRAQELVDICAHRGIRQNSYRLWTAHFDGKHICGPSTCGYLRTRDADGTQWTTHDEHYDESLLHPDFWT